MLLYYYFFRYFMGGGTGSGYLNDSELKRMYNLEFITKIEQNEFRERKLGFSKGRFVVMEVHGYRCEHTETFIGDSFYEILKQQAEKGEYKSAKEFAQDLERDAKPIKY